MGGFVFCVGNADDDQTRLHPRLDPNRYCFLGWRKEVSPIDLGRLGEEDIEARVRGLEPSVRSLGTLGVTIGKQGRCRVTSISVAISFGCFEKSDGCHPPLGFKGAGTARRLRGRSSGMREDLP